MLLVPDLAYECGFGAVDYAARALILTRLMCRIRSGDRYAKVYLRCDRDCI